MRSGENKNKIPHLELIVEGELWSQIPEMESAKEEDKVYTINHESGIIKFGDGIHGKRPASDSDIVAKYYLGGNIDGDMHRRPVLNFKWKPEQLKINQTNGILISFSNEILQFGEVKKCRRLTLGELVLSVLPWPFHKDLPSNYCGKKPRNRFVNVFLLLFCRSLLVNIVSPWPHQSVKDNPIE